MTWGIMVAMWEGRHMSGMCNEKPVNNYALHAVLLLVTDKLRQLGALVAIGNASGPVVAADKHRLLHKMAWEPNDQRQSADDARVQMVG